jgi:serine/threonine protein kinase
MGVCLYELLTGQRLFVGESDYDSLDMVRKGKVVPPSKHNREIPSELEQVILKALSLDVNDRHRFASDLVADLQRFYSLNDSTVGAPDLRQYMSTAFAEDIQREAQRQQEEAMLEPPKDFDDS